MLNSYRRADPTFNAHIRVDGVGMNGGGGHHHPHRGIEGGPLRGENAGGTYSNSGERRDAFSTPKPYTNPR